MITRDSGVSWIGTVPSHWEVAPVRSKFEVQLGKMLNAEASAGPELHPYLRNANVRWGAFDLNDVAEMHFTTGERQRYALREGDILVCEGGEVGRTAIWNDELPGCLYQKAIHRLRPLAPVVAKYFYYCMQAAATQGVFHAEGNANTFVHLTAEKLRAHRFAFPPVAEQQAIARFLDEETARIAALLAARERMLQLLEERRAAVMRAGVSGGLTSDGGVPSRIPWLDALPAPWRAARLTLVAQLGSGHTPARDRAEWWLPEECVVPWITTGEVAQMRSDRIEYISETRECVSEIGIANSAAEIHPAGTVVLCRTAASAGYSAIMGTDMATSQDFATWTCGLLLRPRFLLLCLRVMRQDLLGRLAMGSTHKTIYMPDIESIRIPLPPVEEQDQIVDEVWRRLHAVDRVIHRIERQVELLQEHRQALITAAVTGELDVTRAA